MMSGVDPRFVDRIARGYLKRYKDVGQAEAMAYVDRLGVTKNPPLEDEVRRAIEEILRSKMPR